MKPKLQSLSQSDYFKLSLPIFATLIYYFFHQFLLSAGFYLLGWYAGMALLILDKNQLYRYYYESVHLDNDKFARLITRSLLFILAYLALSIFIITSSGSSLGMGIISGIGLILCFELWQSKTYVEFFNQYFIQAKKQWNKNEIDRFVKFFLVFYSVITFLSVIKF